MDIASNFMTSPLLAAESFWTQPGSWLAMFQVAIALGVVIFVHELGHFMVAKACGVKCEKFYLGFDFFDIKIGGVTILPRALVKFKKGETEYGIGIIPLGGYVKMLGQDDNPSNQQKENERSRLKGEPGEGEAGGQGDAGEPKLDPRSYQAKTVPQRMAIISAGVIMNLIFAVIFATIAYALGVSYTPCEIASTVPGGPAWKEGMKPGDRIVQIGREGEPKEHLRFDNDLRIGVVMAGTQRDVDLLLRDPAGETRWITVRPIKTPNYPIPTIGMTPMQSLTVASLTNDRKGKPAARATPAFAAGDVLKAARIGDGEPIEFASFLDLQAVLAEYAEEPITFSVQRKTDDVSSNSTSTSDGELVEITVAPEKRKSLGAFMHYGAITAIEKGSPAEEAGIQVGDLIWKVHGQKLIDPFELPHLLVGHYGKPVEIVVLRRDESTQAGEKPGLQPVTLTVTPRPPRTLTSSIRQEFGLEELGIVFPILNKVRSVMDDGPAARAGILPGDELVSALYVPPKDSEIDPESIEPMEIEPGKSSWLNAEDALVQHSEPGGKLRVGYVRNSKERSVDLIPFDVSGADADRGIVFEELSEIHTASSFGEALSLGFRETSESAMRVVGFLQRVATGQLSVKNFGGPGTIAYAATSEAKEGLPRLLVFLTLLSANLAVVNFLPIPVLDGGHMMFLIFEGIRGKPLNERWQMNLTFVGFAFVVGLMLFVIGLDVFRFSGWM